MMFISKYKWLIIGILVFLLFLAIFLWGRSSGKDEDKPLPLKAKLPDGGNTLPQGWEPSGIAVKIHDKLKGIYIPNPFGYDQRDLVLNELAELTNDQFVAVYNYFNQNLGEGETLRKWIEDESGISSDVKGKLSTRFSQLGLV